MNGRRYGEPERDGLLVRSRESRRAQPSATGSVVAGAFLAVVYVVMAVNSVGVVIGVLAGISVLVFAAANGVHVDAASQRSNGTRAAQYVGAALQLGVVCGVVAASAALVAGCSVACIVVSVLPLHPVRLSAPLRGRR